MRKLLAAAALGLAMLAPQAQASTPLTKALANRQIKWCLAAHGAHVRLIRGGGQAFWGQPRTRLGKWGSWSLGSWSYGGKRLLVVAAGWSHHRVSANAVQSCTAPLKNQVLG